MFDLPILEILSITLQGLIRLLATVLVVVTAIMVALSIARTIPVPRAVSRAGESSAALLGFTGKAVFPLVTGIFIGLTYGAGVLIGQARSGELTAKDRLLCAVFLGICHAILEDTALFTILGARPTWIIPFRLGSAIIVTAIVGLAYSAIMRRRRAA